MIDDLFAIQESDIVWLVNFAESQGFCELIFGHWTEIDMVAFIFFELSKSQGRFCERLFFWEGRDRSEENCFV